MINFKPFQHLYQQFKGENIRLFESLDKISEYLKSIGSTVDSFFDARGNLNLFTGSFNTQDSGVIPKVISPGILGKSAISDIAPLVEIKGRALRIDNNQGYQTKDSAGTGTTIVYLDNANPDILHIYNGQRNAGGELWIHTGAVGAVTIKIDGAGNINVIGAVYKVAGTQVVGPRGAALTAATAYGGGVAGGTYTAAEQTILNNVVIQALNLKTRLDQL